MKIYPQKFPSFPFTVHSSLHPGSKQPLCFCICKKDSLVFSRTLNKWRQTIYILLFLASVTQRGDFEIHPHSCVCQQVTPLYWWALFHGIDMPHLLTQFSVDGYWVFPGLAIGKKDAMNFHVEVFLCTYFNFSYVNTWESNGYIIW